MTQTSFLSIDPATRRVSLDARDPAFYSDPNRTYAALHASCPTFYWEEQRQWFFTGYDHVNALLRDRRFGRQILHIATREELGMPEPAAHTRHFDRPRNIRCSKSSRRSTPGFARWSIAPSSRAMSRR